MSDTATIEVDALAYNALLDMEDLMEGMNKEFTDSDIPLLTKDFLIDVNAAAKAFVIKNHGKDGGAFINDLFTKVVSRGMPLTERRTRAVLNIMRDRKLGLTSKQRHDASLDPAFDHKCRCTECHSGFDNLVDLVKHKVDKHDYVPTWGSEEQAMVDPVEVLGEDAVDTGLDLSHLPDGYYAVPLPNSYGTAGFTYLRVRRLRANKNHRNRRYTYGKVITGSEFVPAGTLEVAEWSSDSKRLAGEQRPGETYHGEFPAHLEMVLVAPQEFAKLFARELHRCGRCSKALTDDISKSDCFGPECVNKVDEHYFAEWSGKYADRAQTTCPVPGCRQKDGVPVEGEENTYQCSKKHKWVFKPRVPTSV